MKYNYKKEEKFVELFGAYFDQIGIDPVTKQAVVKEEAKQEEERKDSNPVEKFEEALALSDRGKKYEQVMSIPDFDNFLSEMKGNKQHCILLDF